MKIIIAISILFGFTSVALSCDNVSKKNFAHSDELQTWLGNNSEFAKAYKTGKCALDEAFSDMPLSQKKVLASLIAKSYKQNMSKLHENSELNF